MKVISLRPSEPIREPVSKFGGQPIWISEIQWPLSRSTNQPMRFICQIELPAKTQVGGQQMAYLFMTDGEEYVDGTWAAEGGENAVILQPEPFVPIVSVNAIDHGPTLQAPVETSGARRRQFRDAELAMTLVEVPDDGTEANQQISRVLGNPDWLQSEEWPQGGPWLFLMQIDSCNPQYHLNFGDAGIGYAFVAQDGRAARFLWQCG